MALKRLASHADHDDRFALQSESRKRLRVTTGCRTCRSRHVKCSEERPRCRQCAKKNRICFYDRASQAPSLTLANPQATAGDAITSTEAGNRTRDNINAVSHDQLVGRRHSVGAFRDLEHRPQTEHGDYRAAYSATGTITPSSSHASPRANLASILSIADWEPKESQNLAAANFRVDEPIHLEGTDAIVFRNYVNRVAHWADAMSRDKPFTSLVPGLAVKCPVLLHSCMAFSGRQIALTLIGSARKKYERLAVYYYQTALKALGKLLADIECVRSNELLASSIMLSSYEMLDMIGESFESHLIGLAALLQAQGITGAEGGLRGTAFWLWYRHEIWTCMLTEREMTLNETYWQPQQVSSFEDLTQEEIANRSTFIFGQVISFCNERCPDPRQDAMWVASRKVKAQALENALEDWKQKLPSWMAAYHMDPDASDGVRDKIGATPHWPFPSLWFIYPQSAIAYQAHHAANILLALHRPQVDARSQGFYKQPSLATRRHIERSREQICLVASSNLMEEWAFLSLQCLFVAGLVTEGKEERQQTLDLIEDCQRISGRQTVCLADRLRKTWNLEE